MKNKSGILKRSLFSIRSKITLLSTCSILIAVTITFSYLVNVSRNAITESTEITMQGLADSYSKNLSEAVQQISSSVNFMMSSSATSDFVKSKGTENSQEVADLASMFLSSHTSSEDISIVDAKGIVIYSSDNNMVGKDLSGEAYFKDMVANGLSTQGNVFISDKSNEACVTFAIPLRTDMAMVGMNSSAMPSTPDMSASVPDTGTSSDTAMAIPAGEIPAGNMQEEPVTEFTGAIITSVKVSEFNDILSDIKVGNYESGSAFILDSSGNILYHPDAGLIGNPIGINELNDIISLVQAGTIPESKIITYTSGNTKKYAAYSINNNNKWILFIVADQAEVYDSLNVVAGKTLTISIILAALLSLIAYILTGSITKSIKKITVLINKTADLDFSEDTVFASLSLRKDETGEMSRAIGKMRNSLKSMILHIGEVSGKITGSSGNLNNISLSVNSHASDNSATAEELSASMQETVATTEQMNASIEQIGNYSSDITDKVSLGAKLSSDIRTRAADLKTSTESAAKITDKVYEEVKQKTDAALEQAKAVEKISILTKAIKDIASQTKLLALNASIEAARAGEAGSGFAVVAGEIGNLANQSARAVTNINETVNEVYEAVNNMAKSLEQTLGFLDSNVVRDYKAFLEASEKYDKDAGHMSKTMEEIQKQIDLLSNDVRNISESISEINMMISEASKGVNDVAEKNTDIVALTSNTHNMAKENTDYADSLKEIVDKFKL